MPAVNLVAGRDREAQAVIDALQEVYRKSLRPIEELSLFDKVCTYILRVLVCAPGFGCCSPVMHIDDRGGVRLVAVVGGLGWW